MSYLFEIELGTYHLIVGKERAVMFAQKYKQIGKGKRVQN